ncbi:MAG: hypothetical protein KAU06_04740 [Candidatus Marinimicrobia bacterium]|nr:hypothetical protein [Candidatus Neomarinimicrobiota bacterium]
MKIEKIAERVCSWLGIITITVFIWTLDNTWLIFTLILLILATYLNKTMVHLTINFVDGKLRRVLKEYVLKQRPPILRGDGIWLCSYCLKEIDRDLPCQNPDCVTVQAEELLKNTKDIDGG